ncbi:hypothetical protein E2562_007084 [Oryza meyeriana var. granulata]|uniref:Uncharacterized protein n=1 Tax=Oryza meyeriana var. granulata TaxID=110450 RepID=A0A6G1F4Z6_9ORYZ|nr:hypothetical protein E2562_007084 [Oryza meyeriana var. granulata]
MASSNGIRPKLSVLRCCPNHNYASPHHRPWKPGGPDGVRGANGDVGHFPSPSHITAQNMNMVHRWVKIKCIGEEDNTDRRG